MSEKPYLNEKPHDASPPHAAAGRIRVGEFNCECPECGLHWSRWDDERHEAGCPNAPHAAAEPEKPVAWIVPQLRAIADRLRDYNGEREELRNFMANDLTKIADALASPSARPIARDEQDAKRYRFLRDHRTFHHGVSILIAADPGAPSGDVSDNAEFVDAVIDAALKSAGKP